MSTILSFVVTTCYLYTVKARRPIIKYPGSASKESPDHWEIRGSMNPVRAKRTRFVSIGNSKGVILPKKIVDAIGDAELTVEFQDRKIVIYVSGQGDEMKKRREKALKAIKEFQKKHKLSMPADYDWKADYHEHVFDRQK